ncbi:hypothetical protein H0H92_008040, partial [Tricholoma furcatifolium]
METSSSDVPSLCSPSPPTALDHIGAMDFCTGDVPLAMRRSVDQADVMPLTEDYRIPLSSKPDCYRAPKVLVTGCPEWMIPGVSTPVDPYEVLSQMVNNYGFLLQEHAGFCRVIHDLEPMPLPFGLLSQLWLSHDIYSALIFDYGNAIAWRFRTNQINNLGHPFTKTEKVADTRYRHVSWDDPWVALLQNQE